MFEEDKKFEHNYSLEVYKRIIALTNLFLLVREMRWQRINPGSQTEKIEIGSIQKKEEETRLIIDELMSLTPDTPIGIDVRDLLAFFLRRYFSKYVNELESIAPRNNSKIVEALRLQMVIIQSQVSALVFNQNRRVDGEIEIKTLNNPLADLIITIEMKRMALDNLYHGSRGEKGVAIEFEENKDSSSGIIGTLICKSKNQN